MAAYELSDDEAVALAAFQLGGLTYGPIPEEDGYIRGLGWKCGQRVVDREVRSLVAANVLTYVTDVTKTPNTNDTPKLARGTREIYEDGPRHDATDEQGKRQAVR